MSEPWEGHPSRISKGPDVKASEKNLKKQNRAKMLSTAACGVSHSEPAGLDVCVTQAGVNSLSMHVPRQSVRVPPSGCRPRPSPLPMTGHSHTYKLCPLQTLCPELPFPRAESMAWMAFSSVTSQSVMTPSDPL